ncbi:hypothetical protein L1D54_06445 [Vibrio brasiliensis]|uniref:hypothetical protein n=1 Tax=Vibrio brasiliensis TaxID=170652 RepID=UPI001EFE24D6|nr:hypothetical protein [Vibrio brasiliensis]MCG9750112.1 hypothetical protein [Vibrio brasiliensis]
MLLVSVSALSGLYLILNTSEQESIRVAGSKPNDATVKVWANYWVYGDDCEAYSYDMFGRKARQGGKFTTFFTPNEVDSDDRYEFDVPYSSYTNSNNCTVELRDIKVEAYNAFDTVGFAQLRVYQAGTDYYNKPLELTSKIEARDCRARYYEDLNEWSSGLACSFYTNGKLKDRKSDLVVFNAYTVYFDFSKFNSDTVINYDILAGENYRSTPLDPETGK